MKKNGKSTVFTKQTRQIWGTMYDNIYLQNFLTDFAGLFMDTCGNTSLLE